MKVEHGRNAQACDAEYQRGNGSPCESSFQFHGFSPRHEDMPFPILRPVRLIYFITSGKYAAMPPSRRKRPILLIIVDETA
jgi:hypothetical protein